MKHAVDISKENRQIGGAGDRLRRIGLGAAVVGGGASLLLALLGEHGMERMAWSYLTSFTFFLSLGLGALIWILVQHATRAGWSVAVRRLAEAVAGVVPYFTILVIPIVLVWGPKLYQWLDADTVAHDALLQRKQPYLNFGFFLVRVVIYFGVWALLTRYFTATSRAQDQSGDPTLTERMERWAPGGLLLWALTATFFAFDFLMSLDPHWFSTIFGVYFFAGSFFAFNALLCVICYHLQQSGRLTGVISLEHYHDIGKLMFAFTVFWSYIAFSQFMLIWYANLPEETAWIERRYYGPWGWVSALLLFGHFLAPFLLLVSRIPKRRPALLVKIAYWNLFIHFVDLYWLVFPQLGHAGHGGGAHGEAAAAAETGAVAAAHTPVPLHLLDLTCLVFMGGIFLALLAGRLKSASLVAERDPRLVESLTYENA
jgi:hypothetical protein